jgi:hypothetical protein
MSIYEVMFSTIFVQGHGQENKIIYRPLHVMATKFKSTFSPERTCETDPAAYFTTSERIIPSPERARKMRETTKIKCTYILTIQDN